MEILKPFPFQQWIAENREFLKPPVGNKQVYIGNEDFIVMVVAGPNGRKDFHFEDGEELFYQLEGDIQVKIDQSITERIIGTNKLPCIAIFNRNIF